MNVSESLACSSVNSAVISFVVEPIGRRLSAWRAQTTVFELTSITIALGAPTVLGQSGTRAAACAVAGVMARARTPASSARLTRSL